MLFNVDFLPENPSIVPFSKDYQDGDSEPDHSHNCAQLAVACGYRPKWNITCNLAVTWRRSTSTSVAVRCPVASNVRPAYALATGCVERHVPPPAWHFPSTYFAQAQPAITANSGQPR